MPRPRKYATEEFRRVVKQHVDAGMTPEQSAAALAMPMTSWRRYAEEAGFTTKTVTRRTVESCEEYNAFERADPAAGGAGDPDRDAGLLAARV